MPGYGVVNQAFNPNASFPNNVGGNTSYDEENSADDGTFIVFCPNLLLIGEFEKKTNTSIALSALSTNTNSDKPIATITNGH